MNERPPFDVVKAAFYLIAFVFGVYAVVILTGVGMCAWLTQTVETYKCASDGHLVDLLATLLSAALAFAGGMMRGGGPPAPPPPPARPPSRE